MAEEEESRTLFGQLVIGPPGSGKTTYCKRIAEVLTQLGRRVILINIDPANDVSLPYEPAIDIGKLVKVDEVMEKLSLGPNGGLIYAMEYLEANIDWLLDEIKAKSFEIPSQEVQKKPIAGDVEIGPPPPTKNPYLIIDCPGQIELFTNHDSFKRIVNRLTNRKTAGFDLRLVAVYLVDSHYANDPGKFISGLLNSLSAMLHLELPHVNVLSKVDLITKYGHVKFGLSYYCEVLDLSHLVEQLFDDPFLAKYKTMTQKLADVIENYSLVSFMPLDINNNRTIIRVLRQIDRANGFHLLDVETEEQMERIYRDFQAADFDDVRYGEENEKYNL